MPVRDGRACWRGTTSRSSCGSAATRWCNSLRPADTGGRCTGIRPGWCSSATTCEPPDRHAVAPRRAIGVPATRALGARGAVELAPGLAVLRAQLGAEELHRTDHRDRDQAHQQQILDEVGAALVPDES